MKQIMRHTAISAAPVMSAGEFAGPVIGRPVTQFNPMGAGPGAIDATAPANAASGAGRQVQSLALAVQDENDNELAGVTCAPANDQSSWSARAGETVTVRRSALDLRTTCMKERQVIGSAVNVLRANPGTGANRLVWRPGRGHGSGLSHRVSVCPRQRCREYCSQAPLQAKELAMQLPSRRFRTITWREGTNGALSSRFAAVRVHCASREAQPGGPPASDYLSCVFRELSMS
jgi:hypothetical protein